MSYTPITWTDKSTLVEAEHMNAMEQALKDHDDAIEQLSNSLAEFTSGKGIINPIEFNNTESILDQIDALSGTGKFAVFRVPYKSGGMSDIDCPANSNFLGLVFISTANNKNLFLIGEATSTLYKIFRNSSGWGEWKSITFE